MPNLRPVMVHHDKVGRQAFGLAIGDPMCFPGRDIAICPPEKVAAFNKEYEGWHHHADDEVRFFKDGSGTFYIGGLPMLKGEGTSEQRIECKKDTYILVPAGTVHRFQSGPQGFTAWRFFTKKEGGGVPIPN